MDPPSDEDLAARAGGGERECFAELVRRYGTRVRVVLRRRVRDDHLVEDLCQEVWIKVFGALPRFRPEGVFRSWLFAIVLNHARDALRAAGRRRWQSLDDLHGPPTVDPDRSPEQRDQARRVEQALDDVEEPFRTALSLVDLGGLSYAEAAASSGCSLGTLKSRVHRARRVFRRAYLRREGAGAHARLPTTGSMP